MNEFLGLTNPPPPMELVLVPLPMELVLVPVDPHCCFGYVDDGLLALELLLEEEELLLNHPPLDEEDEEDPLLNHPPPPPAVKVLRIKVRELK